MAGGGRVALQTVLGGLAGGLSGFQQAQTRKKEEQQRQLANAIAMAQAGIRPKRQPSATVSPEIPQVGTDVLGAGTPNAPASGRPTTGLSAGPEYAEIPGLPGYEMGPTPAELRAERQRRDQLEQEQKKFDRANRGRFDLLQRGGYIPSGVKYEDIGDEDLSPHMQAYLAGKAQEAALERTRTTIEGRPEPRTSVVPVTKPDGTVVYMTPEQAVGQPVGATAAPKTKTAQELATEARVRTGVSEMVNADKNMRAYEEALINGTTRITADQQLIGNLASSFNSNQPTSQIISSVALAVLGRSRNPADQQLYRYLRRGLAFAEGELMISQRPSDYRTKMAKFLSMASAGSGPDAVRDIQNRRNAILTPLIETINPAASATSATPVVTNPWRQP